jgi:hypothetical protein
MKHGVLNAFLLVAVLSGGVLALLAGRERSRLSRRYERLVRTTGPFSISDPSKLYFQAVDTGEPFHFAWHAYLPANYRMVVIGSLGPDCSSTSNYPRDFIARVRFHQEEQGIMQVYTNFSSSGVRFGFRDKELTELLRDRWDRLLVEQLGTRELAVADHDRPVVLLRLTLPDELAGEARKKLSKDVQKKYVPVVFQLGLDPTLSEP